MDQIDFIADSLPVMELTACGRWSLLGHAHGIAMSRYRHGRGFCWRGSWKVLRLDDPTQGVTVLRWQTDKIVVQRVVAGETA